jgi:hypothetical protein
MVAGHYRKKKRRRRRCCYVHNTSFRYRQHLVWQDSTVGHGVKWEALMRDLLSESICTLLLSVHAFRPGLYHAQYPLDELLVIYPCTQLYYINNISAACLCESKLGETDSNRPKLPALSARLNSTLLPRHVSFVQCPKGHLTHAFLAADPQAYCWPLDTDLHGSFGQVLFLHRGDDSLLAGTQASAVSESENKGRVVVPPMFSCDNGEQEVLYTLLCDHRSDCGDSSDEDFCVFRPCVGGTLECNDGRQVGAPSVPSKYTRYFLKVVNNYSLVFSHYER